MVEIEFDYNQDKIVIQAKLEDTFKEVIDKYCQKALFDPDDLYFIANGGQVMPEEKVENLISIFNSQVKLKVLVYLIQRSTKIKTIQSKDIICPKCKEPCQIKFENCKIILFGCINKHIKELKIKEFFNSQKINISNIKCDICKISNKGNCPNNEFYKCLICNNNICLICKKNHQWNHFIINYDEKDYICNSHFEPFIKYCSKCKKNLCKKCNDEHGNNNQTLFSKNMPNIYAINNNLNEMKKEIELFNKNINDIINKLNELKDLTNILQIYYEINNNIINNFVYKNINYQVLQNINQINDNEIYLKLNKINKMTKIKDQIYNIIDLYEKINSENKEIKFEAFEENKVKLNNAINNPFNHNLNVVTIIYNIDKNKSKIRLFGTDFIKNNKDNCYILINEKQNELIDIYKFKDIQIKDILELKLIETKSITDMSNIFNDCSSLIALPDISNWNTEKVNNMSDMFHNCTSLQVLPDISNWNTKKVTNMCRLFSDCSSLISLPDISKWNTSKVTDMSYMFNLCSSLKSLPDISNWNTINVITMRSMFNRCSSLESLPDISKWNTMNVTTMSYMFYYCKSLISLPDISKWNIKNVTSMSNIFNDCSSLISFPNISYWLINKDLNKDSMFDGCNENIIPRNFK